MPAEAVTPAALIGPDSALRRCRLHLACQKPQVCNELTSLKARSAAKPHNRDGQTTTPLNLGAPASPRRAIFFGAAASPPGRAIARHDAP